MRLIAGARLSAISSLERLYLVVAFVAMALGGTARASAAEPPPTIATLEANGQDFVITQRDGGTANVIVPSNDAGRRTALTLTAVTPGPAAADEDAGTALAEIDLTTNNTTHFWSYPTFYFTLPAGADERAPMLVEFDDGDRRLAVIDRFHLGKAAFVGEQWTRTGQDFAVTLESGHRYRALLVERPRSMLAYGAASAPMPVRLPAERDLTVEFDAPPAIAGGAQISWRTTSAAPVGTPPLALPGAEPLSYATALFVGDVTYEGAVDLTLRLRAAAGAAERDLGVAVFEYPRWRAGWQQLPSTIGTGDAADSVVVHTALPPTRIAYRRYAFVLFRRGPATVAATPAPGPASDPPPITVVGDSTSLLTILPPSAAKCNVDFGPTPICQYTPDPALNYPGVLARTLGTSLVNLSWPTTQAGADWQYGESERTLEVPQIDPSARIVLVTGGFLDAAFAPDDGLLMRVDLMEAAIRARAPGAHIVYVGLRYMNEEATDALRRPRIDAWNQRERELAAAHGDLFIDANALIEPGYSVDAPDGEHLTMEAGRRLAATIAGAMRAWHAWAP